MHNHVIAGGKSFLRLTFHCTYIQHFLYPFICLYGHMGFFGLLTIVKVLDVNNAL